MKKERKQPFVWPTYLSKLIAGEHHCYWRYWFKSHFTGYDTPPSDFNSAMWNVKHTKILRERVDGLTGLGYRVLIENQNSFKLDYCGAVISGKPDIVAFGQEEAYTRDGNVDVVEVAEIDDAKSGKPKTSDSVQIYLYQILLPLAVPEYAKTKFSGCVVYPIGVQNVEIPNTITDDESLKTEIFSTIDKIIGPEVACRKTPSRMECRFCDITKKDCCQKIG